MGWYYLQGLKRVKKGTSRPEVVLDGKTVNFCDGVVVSSADVVYIVEPTHIKPLSPKDVVYVPNIAISSGNHTGRLLKFTPSTGELEVLIDDLDFSDGVELAHDESYVLASEGGSSFRIRRYWLEGPKAGTTDVFIHDLPGFADNVNRAPNGTYWAAIFFRADIFSYLIAKFRLSRYFLSVPPEMLFTKLGKRHSLVVQVWC